jgi:hypothetical protein
MTAEQAAKLKRLAQAAYDLDAFKPNLTCAEADLRIATLIAKLKVLDGRAMERCSRKHHVFVEYFTIMIHERMR